MGIMGIGKRKFADTDIVTAWQTFVGDDPTTGLPYTCLRGQDYRGSNPGVRTNPAFFVPQGTPEGEWPSPIDASVAQDARAEEERAERERRLTRQAI